MRRMKRGTNSDLNMIIFTYITVLLVKLIILFHLHLLFF